jgi:hypothetical protein
MEGRKILARLVKIIHQLIVYFCVLGVFLPSKYLIYYIPIWPLIYLHWQFNSNKCILTELQYWLEFKSSTPTIDLDHNFPFIRSISGNLFKNISNKNLHNFIIRSITLLWIIGVIRYLKFKYLL